MSSSHDGTERPLAPALDHVQLAAPPGCERAARAFYGGLLAGDLPSRPLGDAG